MGQDRQRKQKRILIVDQDADLITSLSSDCQRIGVASERARTVTEAVQVIIQNPPDLICVDASLPGQDGMSLCEMVLQSPDDVKCPVIVFTSGDQPLPTNTNGMCVYMVRKRPQLWKYLEPVIRELISVETSTRTHSTSEPA